MCWGECQLSSRVGRGCCRRCRVDAEIDRWIDRWMDGWGMVVDLAANRCTLHTCVEGERKRQFQEPLRARVNTKNRSCDVWRSHICATKSKRHQSSTIDIATLPAVCAHLYCFPYTPTFALITPFCLPFLFTFLASPLYPMFFPSFSFLFLFLFSRQSGWWGILVSCTTALSLALILKSTMFYLAE